MGNYDMRRMHSYTYTSSFILSHFHIAIAKVYVRSCTEAKRCTDSRKAWAKYSSDSWPPIVSYDLNKQHEIWMQTFASWMYLWRCSFSFSFLRFFAIKFVQQRFYFEWSYTFWEKSNINWLLLPFVCTRICVLAEGRMSSHGGIEHWISLQNIHHILFTGCHCFPVLGTARIRPAQPHRWNNEWNRDVR